MPFLLNVVWLIFLYQAGVFGHCHLLSTIALTQILWRKDGRRINPGKNDNFVIGADGSLTIVAARARDAGTYQCVAKNDGGRRESSWATLTVEGRSTVGTLLVLVRVGGGRGEISKFT